MNDSKNTLNLIVDQGQNSSAPSSGDRMGGQEHGVVEWITGKVVKQVDAAKM